MWVYIGLVGGSPIFLVRGRCGLGGTEWGRVWAFWGSLGNHPRDLRLPFRRLALRGQQLFSVVFMGIIRIRFI